MSQQINLFNPALIKQKDRLTCINFCYAYLACIGACLVWVCWHQFQLESLRLQHKQAAQTLETTQAKLKLTTIEHTPRALDQALVQTLAQLKHKQAEQAMIIDVVSHRLTGNDKYISEYMRGFASSSVDGLWLTGFKVDANEHSVRITGRSLDTVQLPKYIESLRTVKVFAGQSFGGLKISGNTPLTDNKQEYPPKSGEPRQTAKGAFIEFELEAVEPSPISAHGAAMLAPAGSAQSINQVRG